MDKVYISKHSFTKAEVDQYRFSNCVKTVKPNDTYSLLKPSQIIEGCHRVVAWTFCHCHTIAANMETYITRVNKYETIIEKLLILPDFGSPFRF
jgi:hypothetical protein